MIEVSNLDLALTECDNFVQQNPLGKLDYLQGWGAMINSTFDHENFYLAAREGGTLLGILPLTQVRSRLFGNRMMSQAFSNYGGPLADCDEVNARLHSRSVELAKEHDCKTIEFRGVEPVDSETPMSSDKISMYLPLTEDPDRLWKSFDCKFRNQVRKAEKSGMEVIARGVELLEAFYQVWAKRMHELGTPCFPRKLFRNIYTAFPQNAKFFIVRLKDFCVGGAFTYSFKILAQIRWAAIDSKYRNLCANNLLFWSVMRHYCLSGAQVFDFGRTTVGSTQFQFK
jgi:serine/alanine adding enzyme